MVMTRTAALVATGSDNGYGHVSGSGEWMLISGSVAVVVAMAAAAAVAVAVENPTVASLVKIAKCSSVRGGISAEVCSRDTCL